MAESDLIRGNVDTVILKVLYEGDRYGYDMIRQINAKSGGQWEIKQPTLYACLKRLEKQGFVAAYWDASESNGGRRKYYSLTDRGREVFVSYKNEWERSRDLFGELITGDEQPMLASDDDFSDVEDDDYEIPKRKPVRRPREKKAEDTANVEYTPPEYDGPEYIHTTEDEPAPAEQAPAETQEPAEAKEPEKETYVQQSMFDYTPPQEENREGPQKTADSPVVSYADSNYDEPAPVSPAADPHSVIEEIYASTYTGNRSYADARRYAEETTREPAPVQPAPVAETAPAPAQVSSPAPAASKAVEPKETALAAYSAGVSETHEESYARKAYKDVLNELITSCESETEADREQAAADTAADTADGPFIGVRRAVSELGNDVTVRSHNDSAKQYTHKYYYYSNRLMMTHYTLMCAVMFVLGMTLFLTFFVGLGIRMRYDYLLYIFLGLLPIAMFIGAVIMYASDPDKKKRVNVNFRFSMIVRVVIMLQVAVIIYCVNLIWGMPVSFSHNYVPSIVIPLVYSLFIPVSEIVFMTLLKTEHYAAE